MPIEPAMPLVEQAEKAPTYKYVYENIGDLRVHDGHWLHNNVPIDTIMSAICKLNGGTCTLRILIVPLNATYITSDNTLEQASMPITPP